MNFLSKLKNRFKPLKTIIVCVLSLVVVLIFASSFKSKSVTKKQENLTSNFSSLEYCKMQENRLESVLGSVKGISNVKVFVMVSESPEIVFLQDTNKNSQNTSQNESVQTTTVLVKNGSISQPVVKVERLPKITGVLIIAKGAGDLKIKTSLVNIVSSVLGANISNVEVLEGK